LLLNHLSPPDASSHVCDRRETALPPRKARPQLWEKVAQRFLWLAEPERKIIGIFV
jgi:hypothetical protein